MDDLRSTRLTDKPDTPLARLVGHLPLLVGLILVVAAFVLFGGLRLDFAAAGLAVLVVLLALLKQPVITVTHTVERVAPMPVPSVIDQQSLPSFVEALGDPALVLDARGAVLYRNAAAARQYPNLLTGRAMTLVMRNPDLVAAIEGCQRSGEPRSLELHETVPSETWDRVVVSPLRRPDRDWFADANRQLLVTFQSLTELKRVDALRTDFIANASHELRTPLASLIGFIDTLLGPAARDTAAREKFLGIMRSQADRMSRLIDDLLSLSRIEMHQHVRPTGSVDLSALLREVREGLQTQAKAAELEIVMSLPDTPVMVTGDRGQLYEVFENLIDNAIKYGADGKRVEVSLTPVQHLGMRTMVSIIDHGPGVEPEHVPRMTERFYRIDAEASRKKKGTGLGLAIVKHIIQRHRGQLNIKSRPGEGLRVDVMLP
ncbi:two-component system, OmpR family, phosphate regulon sensor histidine kinase PhoR [Devosia lucknowensis]|uniref:histidine kinase n=1 Tax=Devosia lucknowensis TaxID=1096929 RepID=A0A1Y6G5D5_9HYPH|nr:ATP-binding protein [Devosia lucknowensis]SMQ85256.1 two-component system, OmpR family, phosphate regulon sensor histidine kinase PhoR [Devosia lucknowensis]